jgi:hypothetical protein
MSTFPVRDVTALNITNALLGLSVLAIWVVVVVQSLREAKASWKRHRGEAGRSTALSNKRG